MKNQTNKNIPVTLRIFMKQLKKFSKNLTLNRIPLKLPYLKF